MGSSSMGDHLRRDRLVRTMGGSRLPALGDMAVNEAMTRSEAGDSRRWNEHPYMDTAERGICDVCDQPPHRLHGPHGNAPRSPTRQPWWCATHDDFAWLYDDGSLGCLGACILEESSADCIGTTPPSQVTEVRKMTEAGLRR